MNNRDELRQRQSYIQFHACHFGEAHPLFLKGLANAVDGHFHTFVDVSNIAREINANSVSSTARISIYGNLVHCINTKLCANQCKKVEKVINQKYSLQDSLKDTCAAEENSAVLLSMPFNTSTSLRSLLLLVIMCWVSFYYSLPFDSLRSLITLDVHSESEVTDRVRDCISGVIALEKDLERVLQSVSNII